MKKINFILLLSFFTAITILSGCSQPSSSQAEDPPLPPSAQELISDSIYQTAFEGENPKTATQLRFSEDGTYAAMWTVFDYSSKNKTEYELDRDLLRKNNPEKKMEFDDENQYIFMDLKFKYKTKDLLFYGYFSNEYRTYTMTDLKGDPEDVYEHQI